MQTALLAYDEHGGLLVSMVCSADSVLVEVGTVRVPGLWKSHSHAHR